MSDPASSVISWDYPYHVVPYFNPGAVASPLLLSSSQMFLSVRKVCTYAAFSPHVRFLPCFIGN